MTSVETAAENLVLLARAGACLTVTVEWYGDRQGRVRLTRLPGAVAC